MTTPPIDYSSRDFAALQSDIITLAQTLMPEWTNITSPTDFGAVLIELYAYVGDILNYYIDRVANESLLATAQRRQTVLDIAAMLNYTPISATPALGTAKFTLVNGSATTTIPAGTQVSNTPKRGNNAVIFETNTDLIISGSNAATPVLTNANGTVAITQGVTTTNERLTNNFSGALNASFSLYNPNVIHGSIAVTVVDPNTEILWHEVSDIFEETAASQVFTTAIDDNNISTIHFGDGVFGGVPPKGALIVATYRVGGGTIGNLAVSTINELVNPIANVKSVSNLVPTSGGADNESVASMKTNIPKSLVALNRAVTLADYEALALQVPGIAKASASATVSTNVLLRLAPVGGDHTTNPSATGPYTTPGTQKYSVDQYLSDKRLVNVTVQYADPVWDPINISATVHVLPTHYQVTVELAVITAVQSLLMFDNVDFGSPITISQVYHAMQSTPGVDYATLTLLVEQNAATPSGVQDVLPDSTKIPYLGNFTVNMVGGVQ